LILEEPTIFYFGAEALGPHNPLIIDLLMSIVIQVKPYKRQVMSQATMETNAANSSGNPHIPSMTITTWGVPPLKKSSSVQATMVSTASTSSNGLIHSMVEITAPFT
jgi:hypothetical protein